MNNVRKHVEKMFSQYPKTNETNDLIEEVIGNLEAEIEDLQRNGISAEEAIRVSIGKVSNLDGVIEGVKFINKRKIVFEMLQWALIYTLIAWIVTIPFNVIGHFRKGVWLLLLILIILGVIYLILFMTRDLLLNGRISIDLLKIPRLKKTVWIIWGVFLFIAWGGVTGLNFGSNIWFSNPISINGPYEFANIAVLYLLPLITIIFPLLVNRLQRYIEGHEECAENEN